MIFDDTPNGSDLGGEYDVVVVGARVAGSSTAMLLARAGLKVLVLERGRFGADTLSTHALMRAGVLQLDRWGVLPRIVGAGTPPVRHVLFHYGEDVVPVSIKPADGVDALYAPRRTLLDPVLAEAAVEAGARIRYGAGVTDVLRQPHPDSPGGRVHGVRVMIGAGRSCEVRAPLVIGADGRSSLVARQVGARTTVTGRAAGAYLYGYLDHLPTAGYEWFYDAGRSAGAIPTNDGLTCVFVGAPESVVAPLVRARGPRAAFEQLTGRHSASLRERLAGAGLAGPVRYGRGTPGHLRQAVGEGWALVGDAGYWKDPLSTHGITDALRDAEFLARAVVDAFSRGGPSSPAGRRAMATYPATRDRLSARMIRAVEQVAGYAWDLGSVRKLVREIASAMTDEVEALADLPSQLRHTATFPV